jgi:hypothetical protein
MAQSSSTVFVIVEDDLLPNLSGTLLDANLAVVPRAGKNVSLAVKPIVGGTGTLITAAWADSPTNTRPTLAWTTGNKLALGVYYARWRTDPAGSAQWSFPTEDPFTIVVTAKTGT